MSCYIKYYAHDACHHIYSTSITYTAAIRHAEVNAKAEHHHTGFASIIVRSLVCDLRQRSADLSTVVVVVVVIGARLKLPFLPIR